MAFNFDESQRCWIGVVSKSHVELGVQGGFAQLCHGKYNPLKKMSKGDWLIYYSPRTDYPHGEFLQAFTAIGQVEDESVYPYPMSPAFVPFRRNIRYNPSKQVPIRPLLDKLSFTKGNKNWGYLFRTGHFEINQEDFRTIIKEMVSAEEIYEL
jgi:hypothetical protein